MKWDSLCISQYKIVSVIVILPVFLFKNTEGKKFVKRNAVIRFIGNLRIIHADKFLDYKLCILNILLLLFWITKAIITNAASEIIPIYRKKTESYTSISETTITAKITNTDFVYARTKNLP